MDCLTISPWSALHPGHATDHQSSPLSPCDAENSSAVPHSFTKSSGPLHVLQREPPSLALTKSRGHICTYIDFPSQKWGRSQASQLRCCQVILEASIQAKIRQIPYSETFPRNTVNDTTLYMQLRARSMRHQQLPHCYKRQPSLGKCNARWEYV